MGAAPAAAPGGADPRHRRCVALRGDRQATAAAAARVCGALPSVLDVGPEGVPPGRTRSLLGQAFDAVVIDAHDGLDADLLGRCHGLVRGGGALVLRLPPHGETRRWAPLALPTFALDEAGTRFWARLEALLEDPRAVAPAEPLRAPPPAAAGTAEQARVVAALAAGFCDPAPRSFALLADRGRGKSSALGLAVARALAARPLRVAVTAPTRAAAGELLRFAPPDPERVEFLPPEALLREPARHDVVLVDEAAQLPVALLRELVLRRPQARVAFATTTHGYEGTGRGFVLRFLRWLEERRPCSLLSLREPIRWSGGDPLEDWVFRLLALDADLAEADPAGLASPADLPPARQLDRDELARDEGLLRSLFALLVHAHYRTTPNDLQRLLDAPNLAVHAIVRRGEVLAATLLAREGRLSRATCDELARGRWRIRGHALADTLVVHSARPEAGELDLVRSVRIATHPSLRRLGLARALVDHVHASYAPDLFGTLFGATPELLAFRQAVGYQVARVGQSRGARSGEPPVVMLRPASARGAALLADLRADLARDLPLQVQWLAADGGLDLDPALAPALGAGLAAPRALGDDQLAARFARCARGPQPLEAAAHAVERWLLERPDRLTTLPPPERALLEARVLRRQSWPAAARAAGFPDVPAALTAARRALRRLA